MSAGSSWSRVSAGGAGQIGSATVDAGHGSQGGHTVATVGPVVVEDLPNETRFRPPKLLIGHGVVSGVTVVIEGLGAPWGVLGAHTDTRRVFAEDDVLFLQAVANVLAAAIERKKTEDRLNAVADAERSRAAELNTVIASMRDAVVVFDGRGNVLLANPAAETLFGRRLRQGMRAILRSFAWPAGRRPSVLREAESIELQLKADELRPERPASDRPPAPNPWMEVSAYPVRVGEGTGSGSRHDRCHA